eukprot:jgi/Botrbrau1/6467/Bobra.0034s0041.1
MGMSGGVSWREDLVNMFPPHHGSRAGQTQSFSFAAEPSEYSPLAYSLTQLRLINNVKSGCGLKVWKYTKGSYIPIA